VRIHWFGGWKRHPLVGLIIKDAGSDFSSSTFQNIITLSFSLLKKVGEL